MVELDRRVEAVVTSLKKSGKIISICANSINMKIISPTSATSLEALARFSCRRKKWEKWLRFELSGWLLVLFSGAACAQGVGVGTRIDLTSSLQLDSATGQFAQIFIPDYFVPPADGKFTLVFHLHSASWAAEDQVYKSHSNAILFNIHLGSFSSSYQSYFADQTRLNTIFTAVLATLTNQGILAAPQIKLLIVTSFSAGYAGVREIFKVPNYYNRIDALTLADGLYCNSDMATRQQQLQDFLRFAQDARDGKKVMLLTHSSIQTSGYDNTTQTADYLITGIGAARTLVSRTDEIGLLHSVCDTGNFHLRGYYGETAADHLQHLYAMDKMLTQAMMILCPTDVGELAPSDHHRRYTLLQNYPNPFNPVTTIFYHLPQRSGVKLAVFNLAGQCLATLLDDEMVAGAHTVSWNAKRYDAGEYIYQMTANGFISSGKCVLL